MKKLFILSLCLLPILSYSQKILSTPFVYEKNAVYQQFMYSFNGTHEVVYNLENEEDKDYYKNYGPVYQYSYLYEDPWYDRVRVSKLILFKENQHLKWDSLKAYKRNKQLGEWQNSTFVLYENKINKNLTIDTRLNYYSTMYLGINFEKAKTDTVKYGLKKGRVGSYLISDFMYYQKNYFDKGYLKFDKEGKLSLGKKYVPEEIVISDLAKIIIDAILKNRTATGYSDSLFENPLTTAEAYLTLNKKSITGIRLKEDYFMDVLSGKFKSRIMSVALVGNNITPGEEIIWVYYPELEYALINSCTIHEDKLMNYCHVLNDHIVNTQVEYFERTSAPFPKRYKEDYEYLVKLDPLVLVQLFEEQRAFNNKIDYSPNGINLGWNNTTITYKNGKPNGLITGNMKNGAVSFTGNMVDGIPEGEFKFLYSNGKTKAIRNYKNGKREGKQASYYPDGKEYAIFEMENDFPIHLKRLYPNGNLMEEGDFKKGLPEGNWIYRLEASDRFLQILKKTGWAWDGLISNEEPGVIEWRYNCYFVPSFQSPINFYGYYGEYGSLGIREPQ